MLNTDKAPQRHPMNPTNPQSSSTRKWIQPAILVGLPIAWTVFCFFQFWQRDHTWLSFPDVYLPIFIIGLVVTILLNLTTRLAIGLFRNGWRWLFGRQALRLCGWSILFAVSTVALYYNFQRWRGFRSWAAVTQEARQQGEQLVDLETLLGGPVADDQNFAKAPPFAPVFTAALYYDENGKLEYSGTNRAAFAAIQVGNLRWSHEIKQLAWLNGEWTSFPAWLDKKEKWETALNLDRSLSAPTDQNTVTNLSQSSINAGKMLKSLAPFNESMEQLRARSARPSCRFPETFLGARFGLGALNGFNRVLSLRASAQLALGHPEPAFQDVELLLRLNEYLRQTGEMSPELVSDSLQPVWEGLASRQWTEPQLRALQSRLEGLDIMGGYPVFWRVGATRMADFLETAIPTGRAIRPGSPFPNSRENEVVLRMIRWVYPVGWSLHDQALIQRQRLHAIAEFKTAPQFRTVNEQARQMLQDSDPLFQIYLLPRLKEMCVENESFAFAQSAVNQAMLACALERYRLSKGQYPETLDTLAPEFVSAVPNDVMNGKPLSYRRLDNDRFLLYSVGLNQTDDGGKPSPRGLNWLHKPNSEPDLAAGDWVWTYPAGDAR